MTLVVKLWGGLMVLAAAGGFGYMVAESYARRPRELRQLIGSLQLLETEINYAATPLGEAMPRLASASGPPLDALFRRCRELLLEGGGITAGEAWRRSLEEVYERTSLQERDREILLSLGFSLGASDRADQLKHLRLAMSQLAVEEERAREEAARNVRMFRYLGLLGGLALWLLFY